MTVSEDTHGGRASLVGYFGLTFAWTWSLWWAAAAIQVPDWLLFMLFMTGGLGPLVGTAWVLHRGDCAYRRAFLRRIWDPRGVSMHWWVALVAVAAGPAVLGSAVARLTGTAVSIPDYRPETVGSVVVFALAAGLAEEPGWRGAASDVWQVRTRPVWAAFGIGLLWALWHLPLYFVDGSYQHGLGFGSARFWLFSLALVELGVLYVWLATSSGGSILVAILAHAGFNAAGELVPRSTTGDVTALVLLTAATLVMVAATRGRLGSAAATSSDGRPGPLPVDAGAPVEDLSRPLSPRAMPCRRGVSGS